MKDDNDPYDDTRYGHGTGEARDSTAATNNMIGDAGVCPNCRFMPHARRRQLHHRRRPASARRSSTRPTTARSIVQCALGTINNNRFAQAALDYAYAERRARRSPAWPTRTRATTTCPTASNHTLPVHAIEYDGEHRPGRDHVPRLPPVLELRRAELPLGVGRRAARARRPASSPASPASLYSAALKYNVTPAAHRRARRSRSSSRPPTTSTSPSRSSRTPHYTLVAARLRSALRLRPRQRQHGGRGGPRRQDPARRRHHLAHLVHGPLQGSGRRRRSTSWAPSRRSARNSYDYVVEWAPGVQPLDGEFKTIAAEQTNIPPTTVIGERRPARARSTSAPSIPTHTRDVDSPHGENDTAITVRVRADGPLRRRDRRRARRDAAHLLRADRSRRS